MCGPCAITPARFLDAARVASAIVLLKTGITGIIECLKTAVSIRRRIKENFSIAVFNNLIAAPEAALRFATPLIAGLGDVGLIPDGNSEHLRSAVLMEILVYLIPMSKRLGGLCLSAFVWSPKHDQNRDLDADAERVLMDDYDSEPKS